MVRSLRAPVTAPRCDHRWAHVPGGFPICRLCGRVPNASPSQAETWQTCPRKHAYSRVRERKQTEAAAYGDRCHAIAEAWGKHATPPDNRTPEGRTVISTLEHLPPPRRAAVEITLEPVYYGIPWIQRLDFVEGPNDFGDLKTTGDFVHVKSPEVLATKNPQSISYAHTLCTIGRSTFARGRWVYGKRLGKKESAPPARVSRFEISREAAKRAFDELHETTIAPMVRARALHPLQVPKIVSKGSCCAFGGCPYRSECLTREDEMTLAVEALTGGRRDAGGSSLTVATPIVYTSNVNDLLAELQANAAGNAPAPDPKAQAMQYLATLPEDKRLAAAVALGLVPAQAPPVLPPTSVVPPQVVTPTTPPVDVFAAALAQSTAPPQALPPPPNQVFASVTENPAPEPAKRGRPPKVTAAGPAVTTDARTALILACASGGLSPQAAREYLAMVEGG